MKNAKLTPMLQQYLQVKEEHPEGLLFFRMGDFFELFFEDAEIAARELQIALTSRNPNQEDKVPMCGIPHHSLLEYTRQLLAKNYKIVICDQVEDPRQAKGLVKRAVTRILSPGTVVEDSNLQTQDQNYLCAIYYDSSKSRGGLAWIDFSTGKWSGLASGSEAEVWQWLVKLDASEILCPEGQIIPKRFSELTSRITRVSFNPFFDYKRAQEDLLAVQGVSSLDPLDLENKPALVQCCGALLTYLRQTQTKDLNHLPYFKPLQLKRHLILDEVTERNLELFKRLDGSSDSGTLWQVINKTQTPMGARFLRFRIRHPFRDLKPILKVQEAVSFLHTHDGLRQNLRQGLDSVFDLERVANRIILNRFTPRDFVSLRASLQQLPGLMRCLGREPDIDPPPQPVSSLLNSWDNLDDCLRLLEDSLVDNPPQLITEGGLFKPGFDPELDELLELTDHGEARLKELLAREQQDHGLPKLKLGFNRVFGYYFELSKAHKGRVPEHFHRRQTLVNSERYLSDELKELEEKLFSSAEKRKELEYRLFQELRQKVLGRKDRILNMAETLARLDFWQSLAQAARDLDWRLPELHSGQEIRIIQGRHPAVEAAQGASNYIPNDLKLDDQGKILLITGPNMAGKSTVLRQAAIICILAQIGSFVPAAQSRIGLADRIFTRVGASDNLTQGQSTFMVEMTEAARILRQAGKRSLIILDEIGRGTSTFDGLALAWAMVENLAGKGDQGVRTLFATHYHELTDLEGKLPAVKNFNIAVKEWRGDIVFLRKMVPGAADRSYGIEVAKLAGVPQPVIQRSKEILKDLEGKSRNLRGLDQKRSRSEPSLLPGLLQDRSKQSPYKTQSETPHPIISQLKEINPESMTPLEALNLLQRWKDEVHGKAYAQQKR
ncbi:MAG: DNA mismatch repair protein MutS [Thermodesulfobacteriota bacterium]